LNDRTIKQAKMNVLRIGMVVVWAFLIAATAFMAGISRVDLGFSGTGRFADKVVRYYLPYIPVVIFMFVLVLLFGRRGFCHRGFWISPIVAASTATGRWLRIPSLHVAVRNADACTQCGKCTRSCPMSIDVVALVRTKSSLPNNCVQCGACIDSCPQGVLGYRFASESFQRVRQKKPEAGGKA
jgi:ferredoxin